MIKNEDLSTIKYVDARGGFLSVKVERVNDVSRAIFRHHDVNGEVVNEEIRVAE